MVNISKKYLNEELEKNVWELFKKIIRQASSEKDPKNLLGKLFSKSEIAMIEKRLGIFYLLGKGLSYREIGRILDVSSATISFVKKGFRKPDKKVKKEVKDWKEDFLSFMEKIDEKIPASKKLKRFS